jgi:hypothetical protein
MLSRNASRIEIAELHPVVRPILIVSNSIHNRTPLKLLLQEQELENPVGRSVQICKYGRCIEFFVPKGNRSAVGFSFIWWESSSHKMTYKQEGRTFFSPGASPAFSGNDGSASRW